MTELTIDSLKKKYDYWLIVWKTSDDEEIHSPIIFQPGIHPKDYCEEIMKSEWTDGKGRKLRDYYKSYSLFRLTPSEYRDNK